MKTLCFLFSLAIFPVCAHADNPFSVSVLASPKSRFEVTVIKPSTPAPTPVSPVVVQEVVRPRMTTTYYYYTPAPSRQPVYRGRVIRSSGSCSS